MPSSRACSIVLLPGLCLVAAGPAQDASLKALVPEGLLIGAAINRRQSDGLDAAIPIVTRHFNSVTAENLLKWQHVHPDPDRFAFEPADRYVAFGERHGLAVIGHTLVWHQQTPAWVFTGTDGGRPDRDTLLERMRTHIQAVAGRYRGRVHGWDVVNEALDEDGSLRRTPWLEAIGEDYIAKAFEFANAADPDAELYYNDFNLWKPAKRAGAIRLVAQLRRRGLRVDGVGEQGHWRLASPTLPEIEATVAAIAGAGVKVMITELDVDVLPRDPDMAGADLSKQARFRADTNLYPDGLPDEVQAQLARRYADVFALFLTHRSSLSRVTFWGVTDGDSWLNNFPIRGRVNHPLLWDRQGRPKRAFDAVMEVLRTHRAARGRRARGVRPPPRARLRAGAGRWRTRCLDPGPRSRP